MTRISRREFLIASSAGLVWFPFSGCSALTAKGQQDRDLGHSNTDPSPIERLSSIDSKGFSFGGDSPAHPHEWLWNREKRLGQILETPITSEVSVVVAGGGMSGLVSAHLLRQYQPLLLEQATQFGGNSRGESTRASVYSIGAAYVSEPEPGTAAHQLFGELKLHGKYRRVEVSDPFVWQGRTVASIDDRATQRDKRILKGISEYLKDLYFERNGASFPELPVSQSRRRDAIERLDSQSLREHLEKVAGHPLPSAYLAYIHRYCQSAFCGSADEISAAAGLNFLAGEEGKIIAFPGGNSAIAHAIYRHIPPERRRARSLVLDIRKEGEGARVTFVNSDGKLEAVKARAVVCAMPKFVAKHVVAEVSGDQKRAWDELRYRAYMVANVELRKRPPREFFDIYFLDSVSGDSPFHVTDVINASYVESGKSSFVLTAYLPVPVDGVRTEILNTPESLHLKLTRAVTEELLPRLQISSADVVGMRFSRWGHALPLASQGSYVTGKPELISATIQDRIFFVQQDNWVLPAFETVIAEAGRVVPKVKALLG